MLRTVYLICLLSCGSLCHAAQWQIIAQSSNHVDQTFEKGLTKITTTGRDPYIIGRFSGERSSDERVLELEYFSTTGVEDLSVVLGPPITERTRINLPAMSVAEGWQRYSADLGATWENPELTKYKLLRFDLGLRSGTRIQIRNVRLRPRTKAEIANAAVAEQRRAAKTEQAASLKQYLSNSHADLIRSIRIEPTQVVIAVQRPANGNKANLRLYECRPHHVISGDEVKFTLTAHGDHDRIVLPRFSGEYDRIASSWRLKADAMSARRYPTRIASIKGHTQKRHEPTNQKGLSGLSKRGPRSDFVDLGISAVTVNILLNRFVSGKPGHNRVKIPVAGPPVYFDPTPFAHYDQSISFACENNMVVSAILLISSPRQNASRSAIVHPETNGGTYAMPNLTTARGAAIYSFVLNELAKRYRNHQTDPGAITNWIAHNEIDYHTVWTNMGRQPRELVMETYYRSMRLIHNIAVQHNPHARVFASLTHNWDVPDDGRWQRLSPRELLETIQRYCTVEGDFAWGVAYHPYPQSLFADVAWHDKKISDEFDSQLITMQNLEVLGRFLEQPSMLDDNGDRRPVILSEQGFHTSSYKQEAQDRQAGSLYWAMKRLRSMPWVESFIYHRWIDHPKEGGLMLGLRTLPTAKHPHGEKKRSWFVYQGFDTDSESTVASGLPGPQ